MILIFILADRHNTNFRPHDQRDKQWGLINEFFNSQELRIELQPLA